MHAARARIETCHALVHQIDDIIEANTASRGPLWRRATEWLQALAHCYTAIAAHDWERTLQALDAASAAAGSLGLGRVGVEVMALRALALERKGLDGRPLLREAINLAQSHGLGRTFADADPALADWVQRVAEDDGKASGGDTGAPFARIVRPPREPAAGAPRAVPSMVLTPKERSVLELLARSLSNKEIAQAMSVGEETVKWHLKNLFGKLGAGTRKHVVRRAQLLGLLEETE
jgi:LuxR family maltose regulon positive regulatory protein